MGSSIWARLRAKKVTLVQNDLWVISMVQFTPHGDVNEPVGSLPWAIHLSQTVQKSQKVFHAAEITLSGGVQGLVQDTWEIPPFGRSSPFSSFFLPLLFTLPNFKRTPPSCHQTPWICSTSPNYDRTPPDAIEPLPMATTLLGCIVLLPVATELLQVLLNSS